MMLSFPLFRQQSVAFLLLSLVFRLATQRNVLVLGQNLDDRPHMQWEFDAKCAVIASDLNNPIKKEKRPESFFQLLHDPFDCVCVNATTVFLEEFGQGLAGCQTLEVLCAADSSGQDHSFLGEITLLDVFDFTDRRFQGTISNTPIGHFTQQCFTYYELYNQAVICLNFNEKSDACGVQINGNRCVSCERLGPQSYKVNCNNINQEGLFNLDTITDTSPSDASLNGTILRFLDTLVPSRECTGYPQGCAYVETLVNQFPSVVDTFQNPFICQCPNNETDAVNVGLCENGELACVQATDGGDNPFFGSLSYEITFDNITEEFFSTAECFNYATLYDSAQVCIRQDVAFGEECSITVNGEECTSCVLCDAQQNFYQGDCSNVVQGSAFDQCTNPDVSDTIIRFHTTLEQVDTDQCPPLPISGPHYQGVFQMSNQNQNEIAVFKVTDYGYLEQLETVYQTGGLGYAYSNAEDSINDLGSANALMYHVWNKKQWLLAVNPGGPTARASVTIFEIQSDLVLVRKDVATLRGLFACSVTAYEDRVCVLGCGGSLLLECFNLAPSGELTLEQTHDFERTIPNDPLRANAPPVNVNGGGNVLFSPDGSYLGVLYKAIDLQGADPASNDPAGLYLLPVNPRATVGSVTPPYGDFTFVELDGARASYTFAWGADSNTAFVVNTLGDPLNNSSSISVIVNLDSGGGGDTFDDAGGGFTEMGNYGIEAKGASWVEYLDGTLYTGNLDNLGQTRSSVTVVSVIDGVLSSRGEEVFQPSGVGAADLVISGAKMSGTKYLHVALHGGNMIGTYKINDDDSGSLSLVGYTPFPGAPGAGVQWVGAAGIAATTLSEAELIELYVTESPTPRPLTPQPTRMPVAPPTAAPVASGTAASLLSSGAAAVFGCIFGSITLVVFIM